MGILPSQIIKLPAVGVVMSQEKDQAFFRNYSIVLGILTVFIVIFVFAARLVVPSDNELNPRQIAKADNNTAPVGQVRLEGEALPAAEEMLTAVEDSASEVASEPAAPGKQVYSSLCFSCHGTGLPGIPQLGDKSAWAERVAKGIDTLYTNALNGYIGSSGIPMPAKGGNPALTDDEVKAAVDYMVSSTK